MSELRIDPIHKYNVIVAPERDKRPKDSFKEDPDQAKTCPFCPGNENKTPPESFRINDNFNNWIIRAFPNKYPAVTDSSNAKISGYQEVLVETVAHNLNLGDFSEQQLVQVLGAYKNRILDLKVRKKTKAVILFKNQGRQAGATLMHPHSQIVALDFISKEMNQKFNGLYKYYEKKEACYYCDILKKEETVLETDFFTMVIPNNSRFAYETWIIPKRHSAFYEQINGTEQTDLALSLLKLVNLINKKLDKPSLNLILHNGIYSKDVSEFFHWHFQLIPRTYYLAGFEWATGLYINPVDPIQAVQELKNII